MEVDERVGAQPRELLAVSQTHGVVPRSQVSDTPPRADDFSRYKKCAKGDLVLNRFNAYRGGLGVAPVDGMVSPDYLVVRPRKGHLSRYLQYLLRSHYASVEMTRHMGGIGGNDPDTSGFSRIDVRALNRMPVPQWDESEQRAIADFLDRETAKIDRLVEEQQRLVALLKERRAAVIESALVPADGRWISSALKHMLAGVDQGVSPQAEAGLADVGDSWGVLKSGCVNRGVFRQEEHKRLPADFTIDPRNAVRTGDVIVSRASGSPDLVGSCAMVGRLRYNLILSDKLFRLRPRGDVDARFLYWSLNSRWYRTQVRAAISGADGLANNLPLSALRSFQFHYPVLKQQRTIAQYLDEQTSKIDGLIRETETFIDLVRERRAAVINAAVTGQIDVRGEAA